MIEVANIQVDGTLNILGDINERMPVVKDGLLVHYPFDGRAGAIDIHDAREIKQKAFTKVNIMETLNVDWRDPDNWTPYLPETFTGTLSWDYDKDALRVDNCWWGWFEPFIQLDSSKKWYIEATVMRESGLGTFYLGSRSYDANKSSLPGKPGTYDYWGAQGVSPTTGQWISYKNSQISGSPKTGENTTTSDQLTWYTGIEFMKFLFIAGYNNQVGVYYIKDLALYYEDTDDSGLAFSEDGIGIFETSTNVITNTNLDTGWSKGYCAGILWNDIPPPEGVDSPVVSFYDANDKSGYWYCYGDYAPQEPGAVYTISLYAKTRDKAFYINPYTADNSEVGRVYGGAKLVPNDGEWHRLEWTITNPANSQSNSLSFNFSYGSEPGEDQRTWICAPQMEKKPFATPFVVGTRPKADLVVEPKLITNEGSISFDVIKKGPSTIGVNQNAPFLSVAVTKFFLYSGPTDTLKLWLANTIDVAADRIIIPNFLTGIKYHVTVTWLNNTIKLYLNGVFGGEFTDFPYTIMQNEPYYIGCENISTGYIRTGNCYISNFSVYNRQLSQEEISLNAGKGIFVTQDGDVSLDIIEDNPYSDLDDILFFPLTIDLLESKKKNIGPLYGTARFEDGKTWIGSSTVNLFLSNGALGGGAVITSNTSDIWKKVRITTAGHGIRNLVNTGVLVDGETYVSSAVVYNPNNFDITLVFDWCDVVSDSVVLKPGETKQIKLSGSRSTYDATFRFFDIALTGTVPASFWVKDVQIEHEQWRTPYYQGTIPLSRLTYNLPDILTPDNDWTVAVFAKANPQNMNAYPGNGRVSPITVGRYYVDNQSDISIGHGWSGGDLDGTFRIIGYNNKVGEYSSGQINLTPEEYIQWCLYVIKYNAAADTATAQIITKNGLYQLSVTKLLTGLTPWLSLGGYDWDYGNWDGFLKDALVAKRLITDDELMNAFNKKYSKTNNNRTLQVQNEIVEGGVL